MPLKQTNMEILNKIEKLGKGRLFAIQREDDVIISVTNNKNDIPKMIAEEYCDVEVKIVDIVYIKRDYSYEIKTLLIEDGDENEYTFYLHEVVNYSK